MSAAMNRLRLKRYLANFDEFAGDSSTTATATSALAEILKTAGEAGAQKQAKDEADAKAKTDKDAEAKKTAAMASADADAQKARAVATQAQNEANLASLKAQGETAPYGPLHIAAQNAADKAAMRDSEAKVLEAKAAGLRPQSPLSLQMQQGAHGAGKPSSGGIPTWVYAVGGTVVVGGLGLLLVKVLSRPRAATNGGAR